MGTYRKKAVDIEAFQLGKDSFPEWFVGAIAEGTISVFTKAGSTDVRRLFCTVRTLEGVMRAECGDYLIRGVQGEVYPCKREIFEASYEQSPVTVAGKGVEDADDVQMQMRLQSL